MTFIVEDQVPLRFIPSGMKSPMDKVCGNDRANPTTRSCSLMQFLGAESQLTQTGQSAFRGQALIGLFRQE
jgi:hypothetical protein